jgi:hypothetical protein
MGAIDNFLRRFGYARLDRYGLVLTPDDRVMSARPAVLDDGLGGKIVGWLEGDLAAMELDQYRPPRRSSPKKITAPSSLHKLPPAPPAARVIAPAAPVAAAPAPSVSSLPAAAPAPSAAPVAFAPTVPSPARPLPGVAPTPVAVRAPTPVAAPAPAQASAVAATEEPGEDEWEWEIAMARARAAADEAEVARADSLAASAVIASVAMPRKPNKTNHGFAPVHASTRASAPKVPPPLPEPLPEWPGTEPYNESFADKSEIAPQVMSVLQKKLAVARSTPARGAQQVSRSTFGTEPTKTVVETPPAPPSRSTVIPVPQLPTVADPKLVKPAPYTPSASRARMARGTATSGKLEETVKTLAAPPAANDDHTSPYVTLPNEVKPSGFAHTRRVAAKQR